MTKRVFLLMGLSILAVIASHAAGFGQTALLEWSDRYRATSATVLDPYSTPQYYILLCIRQILVWAVPVFLFVSGFFVAYAARGSGSTFTWKMARRRAVDLFLAYAIWSCIWFVLDAFRGITYSPIEYLKRLLTGTADGYGSYYYVLVLAQFYLIAPLIIPLAKSRGRLLLLMSGLLQLITYGLRYWTLLASGPPVLTAIERATSQYWLFFQWAFFFSLGLVCGLQVTRFRDWLARYRFIILAIAAVLGVAAIVEPEVLYRTAGVDWRYLCLTLPTGAYSIAFVLAFLAFDRVPIPFPRAVQQIGQRSYAIYLVHLRAMHLVARAIYGVLPSLLAYPVSVLGPILIVSGLSIPLLLVTVLIKSPARKYYRYLFG